MFRKKLTLTATTCQVLEEFRLILEVWTGSSIRFKHLGLEKILDTRHRGAGAFFVGDREEPIDFFFINNRGKESTFDLRLGAMQFIARFDSSRRVRVVARNSDFGPSLSSVIGTSRTDRQVGPFIPPTVEP